MKDKWLDDIRNRMDSFETSEPDNLWDNILTSLEEKSAPLAPRTLPSSRVRLYLGVAAMLAVIVTMGVWLSRPAVPGSLESVTEEKTYAPATAAQVSAHILPCVHDATASIRKVQAVGITQPIQSIPTDSQAGITPSDTTQIPESTVARPETKDAGLGNAHGSEAARHYEYASTGIARKEHDSGAWTLSIHTSGTPNSATGTTSMSGTPPVATALDNSRWNDSPMLGVLLFNKGREISVRTKHHLPVRTGISIGYRILPRLSVETGLTYTRLASDLSFGSGTHYLSGRQTLHYVGIPITLRYRVFSWKRLDVYAAGGVLAEKCVSGNTRRQYVIESRQVDTERESTKIKQLQWSVNASAGLQMNLSSTTSLYAEPGISYYFDNGSEVETIYKDRPLNFSLNLGLRFTFGHD